MSVTLEDLPAEILNLIVSSCGSQTALAALARTSESFHGLTTPHLYRNVSLSYSYDKRGTNNLCCLTLELLRRPEIAALVHSFTIRHVSSTKDVAESSDDELESTKWQQQPDSDHLLSEAIKAQLALTSEVTEPLTAQAETKETEFDRLRLTRAQQWLQHARLDDNVDPILALLLPNLTNLRYLDVSLSQRGIAYGIGCRIARVHYFREMLERVGSGIKKLNGRSIFGTLTDVTVRGIEKDQLIKPTILALCLRLPAVRRLHGFHQKRDGRFPSGAWYDLPFNQLEPGSSAAELIHLRDSRLTSSNFLKLTQAPKCLKSLVYEIGQERMFLELQEALDAQKTSLEHLCLSHTPPFSCGNNSVELTPMMFQDFSALKRLHIASVYLYGGRRLKHRIFRAVQDNNAPALVKEDFEHTRTLLLHALPKQLETLDLLYCNGVSTLQGVWLSLEHILAHKDEQFPQLVEVSVHSPYDVNLKEALVQFVSLPWKTNGVRFVVRHERYVGDPYGSSEPILQGWHSSVEWPGCLKHFDSQCSVVEVLYDSRKDD